MIISQRRVWLFSSSIKNRVKMAEKLTGNSSSRLMIPSFFLLLLPSFISFFWKIYHPGRGWRCEKIRRGGRKGALDYTMSIRQIAFSALYINVQVENAGATSKKKVAGKEAKKGKRRSARRANIPGRILWEYSLEKKRKKKWEELLASPSSRLV